MNNPTRFRRTIMATTPTAAAATTHRAEAGNRRWGNPSTLVHPMLVV